jgi:hypothetical protein
MISPPDNPLLCHTCGYDLRSSTTGTCPECGISFDPAHLTTRLIPWERRREIGHFRAYLRTVREVCFSPSHITTRLAWPVDLASARRFQLITRLLLIPPFLAAIGWNFLTLDRSSLPRPAFITGSADFAYLLLQSAYSLAVLSVGVAIGLFWSIDIPRPFFARRSLPDPIRRRSHAIGYYTCAPLAIYFPLALLAVLAIYWQTTTGIWIPIGQRLYARLFLLIPLPPLLWLIFTLYLLRKCTGTPWLRCIAILFLTITAAPILAAICAILLLAAANLAALIYFHP